MDSYINKILIGTISSLCLIWIVYYSMQIYSGFTKKEFTIIGNFLGPRLSVTGTAALLWATVFSITTVGVIVFFVAVLRASMAIFF